jgi:hypothetical protein
MSKPEVRYSRRRLPNRKYNISASKQDCKEIPTASCMFLGSGNSEAQLVMIYLEIGNEAFKMAAAKPEVK